MTGSACFPASYPQTPSQNALANRSANAPLRPSLTPIPIPLVSVILTASEGDHPTPASILGLVSPPPPAYATPTESPPTYAMVPAHDETAILLASPPPFNTYSTCHRCELELAQACTHVKRRGGDRITRFLILLNIIVWGMVILGYRTKMPLGWDIQGSVMRGCSNWSDLVAIGELTRNDSGCSSIGAGINSIADVSAAGCIDGQCGWAFVDC
jgi:hypothetical protein